MYKTTQCQPSANFEPNFNVHCTGIDYDERVEFIESVCATLIDSRFGPVSLVPRPVAKLTYRLVGDPEMSSDLLDEEIMPSCFAFLGRSEFHAVNGEFRKVGMIGLPDTQPIVCIGTTALPTNNLGRGSPLNIQGRRSTAAMPPF